MKKCVKCNEIKDLSLFYKKKKSKDGFRNQCKTCFKKASKYYYKENKEEIRKKYGEENLKRYHNNKAERSEYAKQYYRDNKVKLLESNRKYKNSNKNNILEYSRNYYKENKEYFYGKVAERRANRNNASLNGYSEEIMSIYRNCPDGYEVDHIHPLTHKDICGLHVPWNLQYLTKSENRRKNNSFDGTLDNTSWKQKRS